MFAHQTAADGDRYIVVQDFGLPMRPDEWNAESPHGATLADTVSDMLWGQYSNVIKVLRINPILEKCSDVSAEVAEQLVLLSQEDGVSLLPDTIRFVEASGVDPDRAWRGGVRERAEED